ncbi:MAG: anion permease [Armatimonadetes bacterium]|nr:anion permease [Armatimonadota bacterium]
MNYLISSLIFILTLIFILSEKIHRSTAALLGAVSMLGIGKALNFYNEKQALASIDFNTLGLLLGMMILVEILKETGYLEYLALVLAKKTKGNLWHLLIVLGGITSLVSMFLDNVTTIIIIAPITLHIAQIIKINPAPLLLAEALLSNIGGIATLVGDPPNILIASASGFSFNDFLIHLAPLVLIIWGVSLLILKITFKKELKEKITLEELEKSNLSLIIKNPKRLKKILIILLGVIILFFFHHILNFSPAYIALLGAAIALIWVKPDLEELLKEIHFSVLLFFASLFVIVGGLEYSGILKLISQKIVLFSSSNLFLTSILLIWIGGILSAFIDNIPFTMIMIPIIQNLGNQGININPLWWALALGAGLGGNGTPIGASANIVSIVISGKAGYPINFKTWLKSGTLITIISLLLASLLFYFKF